MKNNNKWFSLVLAMWTVIVISLIAYNILEYVIPFWKDVKNIENSSKAYYLANNWIEDWLYFISTRTNEKAEDSKVFSSDIDYKFNTFSSWTVLPPAWDGNSNYDDDWNTISQWSPIQLSIWNWYLQSLSDVKIAFRVPNLDKFNLDSVIETLGWGTLPIINWQLSSKNNTLNASWWIILANQVFSSDADFNFNNIILKDLTWYDLSWDSLISIEDFYWNNCNSNGSWCTLKFSVVNKLELNNNNIWVPYLEWKITIDNAWWTSGNNLPLRYTKIESAWKSIWYKKELEIKVPTKTVNQVFDFTVFQ